MRALLVADADELVEPGLLLQEVFARGPGGFFLERQVHALVTPAGRSRTSSTNAGAQTPNPTAWSVSFKALHNSQARMRLLKGSGTGLQIQFEDVVRSGYCMEGVEELPGKLLGHH
jgi:hypothetical protein